MVLSHSLLFRVWSMHRRQQHHRRGLDLAQTCWVRICSLAQGVLSALESGHQGQVLRRVKGSEGSGADSGC